MSTIQPVILTADPDALLGFYTRLFDAEETFRIPEKGPAFYRGLRIGDTDLGLVTKKRPDDRPDAGPRILLSIAVSDVDETFNRVTALGGSTQGSPTDMPWGSEWPTSRTRRATPST